MRLFLCALLAAALAFGGCGPSIKELRRRADAGDATAQVALGGRYAAGEGVPADPVEAAALYRKAAEAGDADAQLALGALYREGAGVPQDPQQALHWIRRAAEAGNPRAQYVLGAIYQEGDGVPRDLVAAHAWYNLAASRLPPEDRPKAVRQRDWLTSVLTPDQVAEAQRLAREWAPRGR